MIKTFTYYQDPGHGWIKVPMKLVETLGLRDKITSFSYQRNGFAYLEEDGDAGLFIERMKAVGCTPKFKVAHTNRMSRIRNYKSFY